MPTSMNLDGKQEQMEGVRIPDGVFAVHALAVIHVHDSEKNEKTNYSLSHIAMKDEHLRFTQGTLLFGYLLTFGRQGVPLLTKMALKSYEGTEEQLQAKVYEIAAQISAQLD